MVTAELVVDKNMGWKTYMIKVDGLFFCGVTEETGKERVDKLVSLMRPRWRELVALIKASDERREWNMKETREGRQGRDWPAFRNLERVKEELLKEAGIVNT